MQRSNKRLKQEGTPSTTGHDYPAQPQNPPPPPTITSEQEISVMVAALKNVITGGSAANTHQEFRLLQPFECASTATTATTTSSSFFFIDGINNHYQTVETCQLCGYEGCLGCNFFAPAAEVEESKSKSKSKSKSSSQKSMQQEMMRADQRLLNDGGMEIGMSSSGKEMEFWDVIGEEQIQEWMMMMDFHGDSSSSGSGNVHSA
ncbi:hypothetical protein ACH5RR_022179 [Cinchona calisaya]|uniref:Uncharacterized protein n=1 Tax=Cinchona calisaya TaxID=153742 RepID=A0ABD2Z722_9GENT